MASGALEAESSHGADDGRTVAGGAGADVAPLRPVVLHIDLDAFFVQVERRRDPSLIGIPVVVIQDSHVTCASYEAVSARARTRLHDT